MAPAASILAATSAAAAGSKRPADSEPEQLLLPADDSSDNSALPQLQVDDEDARSKSQSHEEQPKQQQQLECPRCRSTNTKFCYYNNYSTAQPRHFCRACRRYWTHGGTLRDVPVGGATRRANKRRIRLSSSADELPSASSACSPPPAHNTTTTTQQHDADIISTAAAAFPFLSDGSYYLPPQLDLGLFAATAAASFSSSWPSSVFPADFYPWDDGTVALGDIAGMDLITWPPPAN